MNNYQKQSGVVLLVSLIMLLLLTVIAITAASQSTLQQRMAANAQQQNNSFQAAESGIQNWIEKFKIAPNSFSTNDSWNTGAGTARYTADAPAANNCVGVIPAISLNADEGNSTFQYGCYEIESVGQSCPDANCNANDNPATSTHIQGYLVRY